MSALNYIRNFIKDRDVASITPTSIRCVKRICTRIDFSRDIFLIEYGPGDGVFSRYILKNMTPGSRLILVESNENFAEQLKESITDSRVNVLNIPAGDIIEQIQPEDVGRVDYVLSGIPFSFLTEDRKMKVLQSTKRLLKPGGKFLAYQTSDHLKKPVMKVFGNVETDLEMLNLPPYLVYEVTNKDH